ncbi:MAG TPA: hypothetical protein DCL81_04890 [Algoriphagus sp.]|jgi:hypothetical protein|uniref:hypothetical protein n=1 Tax=Algoriphagus sp. TaxID=1872435 RepID=UPI000C598F83|nr:hypothetical protein [Algoriphagus sp.]MAL13383.1 hypothetical protein [Algoriphagus sp.]MAN85549.1 hypothetical protein [Algoriphagus sp.]HAD52270.1 hypothetical protein [Algoriphagus sp.]HAH35875.1 hypothetical protein [Algoriphagus sp.]HAS58516.1 hypothetical protein [Algoriphagus sp.]|tara:strand:+ start:16930 stop:17277 length:348 start_codon:yes stop_codon:yes gene_type:complete
MGIILFFLSIILAIPLTLINLSIVLVKSPSLKSLDGYFYQTAVDIDRFGNRNLRTLLNATLIKSDAFPFGDPRETISSVLGKNQQSGNLTLTGKALVWILDTLDENHCEKSIRWF